MLKNNFKRSFSDKSGNALIVALLTMAVAVLFIGSFMYSTQSAAKVEANVDANEQAYLVAKSGLVLFEDYLQQKADDGMTADAICNAYNSTSGYTASVGDGSMGTFTVYVNKNSLSSTGYSITSIGQYGDQQFKLYDYYEVPEDDDEDQDRGGKGAAPKAACITYNTGTVTYKGGVQGDIQQLSETGTISDSELKGDLGTIYSVGNINFDGDGSSCTAEGIFAKGTLQVGHKMVVKGETYVGELVKGSTTSDVKFLNDVYVQNDLKWDQTGDNCEINGNLYVGGDAEIKSLKITGNVYVDGDLVLGQKANIGGDIYCAGNVTFKEQDGSGATVGGGVYSGDGITFDSTNTGKFSITGLLFSYGQIVESKGEFTSRSTYSVGGNGSYASVDALYAYVHGSGVPADVAKAEILDTLGNFSETIQRKIQESLPKTAKPVTKVPSDLVNGVNVAIYNSWGDVPTYGGDYYVSTSCVFNFFVDLNDKNLIIKADGVNATGGATEKDQVDIYFKKGLAVRNANETTCTSSAHIYVDDTEHKDLIRFFFPPKTTIDAAGGMILLYGKWAIEPVRNGSRSVSKVVTDSYVPNLYVFTEDSASNVANYGLVFGSSATCSCFPGYWLTPNVNLSLGDNCAYKGGTEPVSKSGNQFPIIHGMLTTDMQVNQNGNGIMILYHDPDVNKDSGVLDSDGLGQSWSFEKATADVYTYE